MHHNSPRPTQDQAKGEGDRASLNLFSQFLSLCHLLGNYWDLPAPANRPTHPSVIRCLEILESQFNEPLTIDGLAASCGNINPSYLMRLFNAQIGETIIDCLIKRRLEAAANLLLTSHLSITEIAFHCGFNDSAYFSRRFSRHYHMSPRAFRSEFKTGS